MSAIGVLLPRIELVTVGPDGVTIYPHPTPGDYNNITLNYKFGVTRFDVDWPPQILNEVELADHSIVQNIAGYRFQLALSFSNRYLNETDTMSRVAVEDFLHAMSYWTTLDSANRIRVYPHQDNTHLYYFCYIPEGGYIKKKAIYSDGLKTKTHDWDLILISRTLVSEKPTESTVT